jgi:hypothetical protein
MTLQEAKEQVADYHYGGMFKWDALQDHIKVTLLEQVIDLYARSKWDEACEAQKEICSKNYMAIDVYDHSNKFETIDREIDAIKNAEKPPFNL